MNVKPYFLGDRETCMKCQTPFSDNLHEMLDPLSGKSKKTVSKCCPLKFFSA